MNNRIRSRLLATAMVAALAAGPALALADPAAETTGSWDKFFDYGSCIVGIATLPPTGGATMIPVVFNCARVVIKHWND